MIKNINKSVLQERKSPSTYIGNLVTKAAQYEVAMFKDIKSTTFDHQNSLKSSDQNADIENVMPEMVAP